MIRIASWFRVSCHPPIATLFPILQIIQTDTGEVCGQNDTRFQCDGSCSTFRVTFKEPVEMEANTSYTACATLKVTYSIYYYGKEIKKIFCRYFR